MHQNLVSCEQIKVKLRCPKIIKDDSRRRLKTEKRGSVDGGQINTELSVSTCQKEGMPLSTCYESISGIERCDLADRSLF